MPLTEHPDERRLSGRVGGLLWIGGGIVILMTRLLNSAPREMPLGLVIGLTAAAWIWGLLSFTTIDWVNGPPWLNHITAAAGLVLLALATDLTGQEYSVGWYFTWLALYGCFFFYRQAAIGFMGLCFVAQVVPLLGHLGRAAHNGALAHLVVLSVGYVAVGGALIQGKELLTGLRRQAEREADTDTVTGLGNHRRIGRGLANCVANAEQTGQPFAIAVLDIDLLKQLSEMQGQDRAEAAVKAVAAAMRSAAAGGDELARTGGDEFLWLMPDTTAAEALMRVERARMRLAHDAAQLRVRFSAGVTDSTRDIAPAALIRYAEGALYWSKRQGRNRSRVYDAAVMPVLSAEERIEALERSQTLLGLRALARAIDAKDPATQRHSERVARIAEALARESGWSAEAARALRAAALLHDVGKIGIEDAILRKPSQLTPEERAQVNTHAEISARIVAGVLSPDQVEWIRTHHERADGAGYPRGLTAAEIPEGGALLAIADAFDAMTGDRPYSVGRSPEAALAVCQAEVDAHFTPAAVAALQAWMSAGPPALSPDWDLADTGLDPDAVAAASRR